MGEATVNRPKKLAIVTTHPIQYNAPFFKLLHQRGKVAVHVFYTWGASVMENKYDPGFQRIVTWDIPLLDGYPYTFVKNISKDPGSHHFKGIQNPGLIDAVKKFEPDALLIFGWSFSSHLKLLRYFKGKKTILFRGDSTLLDEAKGISFKKILRRIALQWVYRHVDKVLFVGSANKQYFLAHGVKNNQLLFVPHAIDNDRFRQNNVAFHKEASGIPTDSVIFLFAAKFESKKNPLLLLEAFARLEDTKAHLLLVGNGPLEAELKQQVSMLPRSVSSRIQFLPFQNQLKMPEVYRMGDVFVLPSSSPGETWGLAVNEAMASGKAVLVSTKCGCAADLVQNEKNGYTFQSNDVHDLVAKMNLLLQQKEKLLEMGKQSQEIIEEWSYTRICSAIEAILLPHS